MSELPPHVVERVQHILPSDLIHDLRTLIGHVLGYSDLLRELPQDAKQPELILYTERIHLAGEQLLTMLDENFSSSGAVDSNTAKSAKNPDGQTSTK